jgi:insertion element IS1 protein InsB
MNGQAYGEFVDKQRHVVAKRGTTQVESHNSNIGHYLARFRRKTKCYSKKKRMVCLSLYLLMYKDLLSSIL